MMSWHTQTKVALMRAARKGNASTKADFKAVARAVAKAQAQPEAMAVIKAQARTDPKREAKAMIKSQVKAAIRPQVKAVAKRDVKAAFTPEVKAVTTAHLKAVNENEPSITPRAEARAESWLVRSSATQNKAKQKSRGAAPGDLGRGMSSCAGEFTPPLDASLFSGAAQVDGSTASELNVKSAAFLAN